MKINKILCSLLLVSTFLGGCNVFDSKTPLTGKRETLFSIDRSLKAEGNINVASVELAPSTTNTSWSIAGGSPNHVLPILAVANPNSTVAACVGAK